MIWVFIIVSLILSYLPLINKKIELSNYMWLLIPIDAYGISVAGATIKPYMILALILPFVFYAKNKCASTDLSASKSQLMGGIVAILILIQSIFVSENIAVVKAASMLIVVYICTQVYTSCSDQTKFEQLSDIFIASCFGCSIVFVLSYILVQMNINISGLVATDRTQDGIFMLMSNMTSGRHIEAFRLRGFSFDPNTMFPQFIFGATACVTKLFKKFSIYHILTLGLSLFCILLSSSRMGLLCFAFALAITLILNISRIESIRKKVISIISVITGCVVVIIVSLSKYGQMILSLLLSTYANRSSLTDEYGRFSIWKECLQVYWDESPLFGIGLGKMDEFTITERMTHNTWLQFICECGIIVGGIAVLYFISIMIFGWAKVGKIHLKNQSNTVYICLLVGYTTTIISLASADNITCSYLWFSALLLLKMISCYDNTESNTQLL